MTPLVRITRHARNRLRLYHLAEADVIEALTQPDLVEPSDHGRQNAWKLLNGRWLRVTYIEDSGTILVITATARPSRKDGPEGV